MDKEFYKIKSKKENIMKIQRMHPAEKIAYTMTRLYDNNLTTTSGGNLSIMDETGTMWISPSGVDKAHLTRNDIMWITPDGKINGAHRPSTEFPFHLAVLRSRPDLKAVLHAHPAALVAYSLERCLPELDLIPGVSELCGKIAIAKYALPGSQKLGDYIAEKFREGCDTVLLENHGVVLGADSLEKAYMMFEALDFAARIGIAAAMLKKDGHVLTKAELELKNKLTKLPSTLEPEFPGRDEIDVRNSIVDMSKRCYKNKLFTAATGVYAVRTADGFIITPEGEDRQTLTQCMLVKVKNGEAEKGKVPSVYADIIGKIFAAHDDINSVAIAKAPYIMGFAVTGAEFNSHMIPEGYICLKNVSRHAYGTIENEPEKLVDALTMKTPIAIVDSDCVVVAGTSALNAYDRLEVLEFGATSLCYISAMNGKIEPISEDEIKEIEVAFNL